MKNLLLLIEDDARDAELILRNLRQEFDCHHVQTLGAGAEALESHDWDAVVLDLRLPDSRPENLSQLICRIRLEPRRTAIVILTGAFPMDPNLEAMREHVDAVYRKDEIGPDLGAKIHQAIARAQNEPRLSVLSTACLALANLFLPKPRPGIPMAVS